MKIDNTLAELEERLGSDDWDVRASLVDAAKGILGSCTRIITNRILVIRDKQKKQGIDDFNAPEIVALMKESKKYHQEREALFERDNDDALRRTYTTHKAFADEFEHEVLERAKRKSDERNKAKKEIPNLNGGPR